MLKITKKLDFTALLALLFNNNTINSIQEGDTGSLKIDLGNGKSRIIMRDHYRTPHCYQLLGIGPRPEDNFDLKTDQNAVEVDNLCSGDWIVMINALSAKQDVIGTGVRIITV